MLAASTLLAFALLLLARSPEPAFACQPDGPCDSATVDVLCPADNGDGEGTATFNLPKDAVNVSFKIVDAETGVEYDADHPICSGTEMTVSGGVPLGEDSLQVKYTIHNSGGGNPAEHHKVKIVANWKRMADVEVDKELLGGGDTINSDEEVTFVVTLTNHGPAPSSILNLLDRLAGANSSDSKDPGPLRSRGRSRSSARSRLSHSGASPGRSSTAPGR